MKIKTAALIFLISIMVIGGGYFLARSELFSSNEAKPEIPMAFADPLDIYRTNLIASQQKILDSFHNATRYDIELRIDESMTSFYGNQKVDYTNNEDSPLDKLLFSLIPNTGGDYLHVENIQVNDSHITGSLAYSNSALEIDLEVPLQPGESIQVSMDFSGTVPEKMGGNYGLYIYQHEILALDSFFPIIPVYEEGNWKVQVPPQNADLIYSDAAFFKVRVDAPKELVLVASGSEIEKQIIKDRQIIIFAGGPQRDFYLAGSTRFQEISKKNGEVKISSYYPKEFRRSGELVLETTAKALRVFSERYGQFPYTEYDLVSTPMQAGGMEYSGAAAMALGSYSAGNAASGTYNSDFLEFATVHEAAHQWFFNQVMSNQIDEPWLDEGLAQYLTYVYYLDAYGIKAADQIRALFEGYWSRAENQLIPIGKPAGDYDSVEYAAIIYGRAPLFILELEKRMGEEDFSRFLADYVSEYRWRTVNSQQFQTLAQETCGCELTALFDEWGANDQ